MEVAYRECANVDYRDLRRDVVVSIDLDVLREAEVRSDCPQGVWSVSDLLSAIGQVKRRQSRIVGWMICGADVAKGKRLDEVSLRTLSEVVGACWESAPSRP